MNPLPTARNSQNAETIQNQTQTQEPPSPSAVLSPTAATSQPSPAVQTRNSTPNPQGWDNWFWQNFSALLIAVLAVWASCIGLSTLDAIRQQGETAAKDLIITNQAYLHLLEVRITFHEPQHVFEEITTYPYEIVYPIYNGGQTPALYIGSFARTIVAEVAPQQISEAAAVVDNPQSAVVPPRSQEPLRPLYSSFISKRELDDIRAGKRKLFFYGMLTYRDIFDKERHTRFTLSFSGTPAEVGKFRPMPFESGKGLNWFD